jgi:Protein of unknown function (DUF5672)
MKVLPESWNQYIEQFRNLPSSYLQNIPAVGTTNKFCVMIEPRKHILLVPVIKNFMYILQNKGYGIIFAHGTRNKEMVERENIPNIGYLNTGYSNMTIGQYNHLLKSSLFWKILLAMGCEHALVFQTDTLLLKDNLDDYLQYDYIGAPWATNTLFTNKKMENKVGNGGLSLRKTRTMIDIIEAMKSKISTNSPDYNEDIYFSNNCYKMGYNISPFDVAASFSVETLYHPSPMGMHGIFDNVYSPQQLSNILSKRFFSEEESSSFPKSTMGLNEYDYTPLVKPGENPNTSQSIMSKKESFHHQFKQAMPTLKNTSSTTVSFQGNFIPKSSSIQKMTMRI